MNNFIDIYIYIYILLLMLALCPSAILVAQGPAQVMEILNTKTHNVPQLTSCSQAMHEVRANK